MDVSQNQEPVFVTRPGFLVSLSYLGCFLFGIALILNTQPMGDGAWFWYARLLLQGKHIYSNMHLALQPLYILETAATLKILGMGWLVGKVPALVHLLAYLTGLWLLVRRTGWTDAQCAVLLASIFIVSIQFVGYRFDDYHVLADTFQIYCLYLLLRLGKVRDNRGNFGIAALLGMLCGLALVTRVNDGGLLLLTVGFAAFFCTPFRRLLHVFVLLSTAAVTVVAMVLLTRDSLSAWLSNALLHAAANKGGTSQVLLYPLQLPWHTLEFFVGSGEDAIALFYTVVVASVLTWLLHGVLRSEFKRHWRWRIAAVLVLVAAAHHLAAIHLHGKLTATICAVIVLVSFVVDAIILWRLLRGLLYREPWHARELLLLIPTGQLLSGSMSSGGYFLPLYTPIAIQLLLLAVLFPTFWPSRSVRRHAFLVTAVLVSFWVVPFKYRMSFSWHTYVEKPMFTDRVWYRHPVYGPMYIQKENLAFMQASCDAVRRSGSTDLLSMPYPYINYFCDISPWHDYVQTFFDTAGDPVILPLLKDLQTSPPEWIVYQRQLWVLELHENIYNHGLPLPHRRIDEIIAEQVGRGEWKVEQQAPLGLNAQWYLIHTR